MRDVNRVQNSESQDRLRVTWREFFCQYGVNTVWLNLMSINAAKDDGLPSLLFNGLWMDTAKIFYIMVRNPGTDGAFCVTFEQYRLWISVWCWIFEFFSPLPVLENVQLWRARRTNPSWTQWMVIQTWHFFFSLSVVAWPLLLTEFNSGQLL